MGDKVLLLLLVLLLTIVKSQSQTITENEKVAPASSSDDLQPSDSTIKFLVMDPEEEKNGNPENGMTSTDDDDDDDDPEGLKMLKSLLDGTGLFEDFVGENNTEQGDSASVKLASAVTEEPLLASNSDDVETRSEAPELSQPNFQRNSFDESKEERETERPSSFMPENNRLRNEPTTENSPVFQLTQGGYQRPFQSVNDFRDQRQSFRSESAPQQAEAVRTPNSNENSDRTRGRQQSYNSIFQPPFAFQPGPVFRHPFAQQPINFANANGRIPSDIQNSFYNTQPDFSQGQYPQLENAGNFPTVFSLQTDQRNPFASSEYLFQAPFQVPVSQSVPTHMPGQMPQFFQQESSPGYSNYDNSMNQAGSGFPALFGNPQANTQYQRSPNLFNGNPNLRGNIFANPALSFLSTYPNSEERSQIPPRFINPQQRARVPVQNNVRPGQMLSSTPAESEEKQTELLTETPNKENPISVPFGARIQRPNNGEEQNNFERQDNVYMRYPMTEAGYATEETLPTKNVTEKESKENVAPLRQPFPFFTVPRSYNVYNSPDPYRAALETVQRGFPNVRIEDNDNQNETEGSTPEQFSQGLPGMPNQERPEAPPQLFRTYPERNPGLSIPDASFYPIQGVRPNRNPFEPIAIFPENHFQFAPRPVETKEQTQTPACAKATNDTICFEDPAYPRGEILYALNSDSFLTQRLVTPDQQLEKIPLIEQNATTEGNEENYICKSDIKYGLPLRAQNTKGNWKVIINMDRTIGRGNFKQPVRLETCRGMGDPCTSVADIKTACVQKYSLQRLLSWSVEKGVHDDVYRLPIACSCQILEQKE